ncbi:Eukaryotic translation initiation factor 5A-5, partial [Capsicum chinense]
PHVNRTNYQLIDISEDGFVSRLTKNGYTKDELRLLNDDTLLAQVKDGFAEEGPGFVCDVRHGGGTDLWYQGYWSQNLIDLARSESSKIETTGLRRKEESYINKSLLTLGTILPFSKYLGISMIASYSRDAWYVSRMPIRFTISAAEYNFGLYLSMILIGQVRSYRYDKELVDPDTANVEATILHESIRTK